MMYPERIWIDLETTGLNENIDFILEFAIGVTDRNGEWIDSESWLLPPTYRTKQAAVDRAKNDTFVNNMHIHSGLWKDLETAPHLVEVDAEMRILMYLTTFQFKNPMPMCGSSVGFDRKFIAKFMPQLDLWFHYRNIDISSVKELCKDLNPGVYSRLETETHPQKLHRGVSDLQDTVEEYRFYKDNFLVVE